MHVVRPLFRPLLFMYLLILVPALACGLPETNPGPPTLTPPPPPTPPGNTIVFNAPYLITLAPENRIPGTRVFYAGPQDGVYVFLIDGLTRYTRLNDTILWRGVIAPNVVGNYSLQIKAENNQQLILEGIAQVTVLNPQPFNVPLSSLPASPPEFDAIPIDYVVPEGATVPGTTLVYAGQNNGIAELTGGPGYPRFSLGDSVIWTGRLQSNVLIRYDLIVTRLDAYGIGLAGSARLWILR